jgi:hypothetical protein
VAVERKRIEQELDWLRKVKVIDQSLRLYATWSNVSFKLLLAIGKLVSDAHCGPIGPITINALACAELIEKAISAEGVMAAPAIVMGSMGIAASNAVLSRIRAYDTGSFKLSLVLGVSGGGRRKGELHGVHRRAGAGLQRRFQRAGRSPIPHGFHPHRRGGG